jgi:protocatechuate 3,4-dioxygenase beta subunit
VQRKLDIKRVIRSHSRGSTLKTICQFILAVLCMVASVPVCAGQEETAPAAAPANEAKSLVQGKVIQDPGGQGIRKVKVTLAGGSAQNREPYQTATDERGQFKIEGVAPGTYAVELERPGFAPDPKATRDRTVKVIAGQDTKDLILHMQMAGVISGKIVDADGDPLRNVTVTATAAPPEKTRRNGGMTQTGATNDLGEYRIADLPPGKYVVQATPPQNEGPLPSPTDKGAPKDRMVYVTTYFPGTLDERQAAVLEVPSGGTAIANLGVQTSRAYRVSGTIVGLVDTRMAQLILIGRHGEHEAQSLADGGKFEFAKVLPGTYKAQVITISGVLALPGQDKQMPSLKMQTIQTPIEVNGADLVGLQLQVESGGDVAGRFRMDGDEKVSWAGLMVSLLPVPEPDEGSPELFAMPHPVNEDGSFEIKDAPAGDCQLAVSAVSDQFRDYYTKSVLLGGREVADTGFTVTAGMRLDVVVSAKGAALEGTVVDGDGRPVASASVVTVPASGKLGRPDAYQAGNADENGHFNLRGMNPGEFVVLAFEQMSGSYRTPEFAKKYEGKGEKVKLEEGAKKSVVVKLITDDGEEQ